MRDIEEPIAINNKIIGKIVTYKPDFLNGKMKYILLNGTNHPIYENVKGLNCELFEINRSEEEGTIDLIAKTEEGSLTHYRIEKDKMLKSTVDFTGYRIVNNDLLILSNKNKYALYRSKDDPKNNSKGTKTLTPFFSQITILPENEFYFIDEIRSLLKTTILQGRFNSKGNYTSVIDAKNNINYGPMTKEEYTRLREELSKTKIFNRKQKQKKITNN